MNALIELRLRDVLERHERERTYRVAEREAALASRTLRHRVGESLIRLGRLVAGDHRASPLWTG